MCLPARTSRHAIEGAILFIASVKKEKNPSSERHKSDIRLDLRCHDSNTWRVRRMVQRMTTAEWNHTTFFFLFLFADSATAAKMFCTTQSFCPVAAAAWHSDPSRGKADCASCVIREKWRNESAFSPFIITGKRKQFCQAKGGKKKSCSVSMCF